MDLLDWNAALTKGLVAPGDASRRLYLYVDRGTLAELGGFSDGDAAAVDFSRAFRQTTQREPFNLSYRSALDWRRSGWAGEPPIVASLAITVLAVTDDPLGGAHGVYRQQNQLLGLPPEAKPPPGYADHVPAMWRIWNEWLEGPGSIYGRPSARTHPHWTNQGWARSQALMRFRDRLALEDFFASVRLVPDDSDDPEKLASDFLAWLRYRGAAGAQLLERLGDEAARTVLRDVVEDEARRWDGTGRRRGASGRSVRGLLFYDAWEGRLGVVVEVDERIRRAPVNVGGEVICADEHDDYVSVDTGVSDASLLADGLRWAMRPDLLLTVSPGPVHVFRQDPLLGGLLQVRGMVAATEYSLLVRDDRLPEVRVVLGQDLRLADRSPGTPLGWTWAHGIAPTEDSTALRALGLGSLARVRSSAYRLQGGLRLGRTTYLTGGEPDVIVPAGQSVSFQGDTFEAFDLDVVVQLSDLYPAPGQHEVTGSEGALTFRTADFFREVAEGSAFSVRLPEAAMPRGGRKHLVSGELAPSPVTQLSGAHISGASGSRSSILRARLLPGQRAIVVNEQGDVIEVHPDTERWLRQIDLNPSTVDVGRAVRSMSPRPAFFLVYSQRRGQIEATEVPEHLPLPPGTVTQALASELTSKVFATKWHWVGQEGERRRSAVFSKVVSKAPTFLRPDFAVTRRAPKTSTYIRHDIAQGQLTSNPYDDIVDWLSERESLSASLAGFAETWSWLCGRSGYRVSAGWRIALSRLGDLGFVERDLARQRVHIARPTLVELPASNGLFLLTGARPTRLVERLEDEDDQNAVVSTGSSSWLIHRRTQIDHVGAPEAPTAMYVEVDPSHMEEVGRGMLELGVELAGCTPDTLLALMPTATQSLLSGTRLDLSPSSTAQRREGSPTGRTDWKGAANDEQAGLYRYQLARGTQYAYRPSAGQPLVSVTLSTGTWLDERRLHHTRWLEFDLATRRLFVPRSLPLSWMLRRALTLRTGLLPPTARPSLYDDMRYATHQTFENVDTATAMTVARILGQEPTG